MRFKVRSYPMGFLTNTVNPQELAQVVNEAARGGYRFKREEVTIEPRRVLFFFMALALNVVFKWEQDEPGYEYKIFTHKTRLFTQTVNAGQLMTELNGAVQGGYEVYFGFKHLTRFLLVIPRETYFFVLRRRLDGANRPVSYRVVEYAYRFFTNTLDPVAYEKVLNEQGMDSRHVVSFRDEKRLFGIFRQIIALTLFEDGPPQPAFQQPQGYQQLPQGYPQQAQGYPQGYPPPGYPQR